MYYLPDLSLKDVHICVECSVKDEYWYEHH
jgi:hypothetical protein